MLGWSSFACSAQPAAPACDHPAFGAASGCSGRLRPGAASGAAVLLRLRLPAFFVSFFATYQRSSCSVFSGCFCGAGSSFFPNIRAQTLGKVAQPCGDLRVIHTRRTRPRRSCPASRRQCRTASSQRWCPSAPPRCFQDRPGSVRRRCRRQAPAGWRRSPHPERCQHRLRLVNIPVFRLRQQLCLPGHDTPRRASRCSSTWNVNSTLPCGTSGAAVPAAAGDAAEQFRASRPSAASPVKRRVEQRPRAAVQILLPLMSSGRLDELVFDDIIAGPCIDEDKCSRRRP